MSFSDPQMPPAMILCGGQGTRIREVTELLPKPMVPVGPHPIVWHIMKTYASFGVHRFILCLGYKRESFIDYFLNYRARATDITVDLGRGDVTYHGDHGEENWEITLADTGDATMTGGRVARASRYLKSRDEHCFLTYGDGLSDIDITRLLNHHLSHDKALTTTAVRPSSRFGEMTLQGSDVVEFREKPLTNVGFINGGFMVARRRFFDQYLEPDDQLVLEDRPMRDAAAANDLSAYVHEGFWQCMDTAREHQLLTGLWDSGKAPWMKRWQTPPTLSVDSARSKSTGAEISKPSDRIPKAA